MIPIIPKPSQIEKQDGSFRFTLQTVLDFSEREAPVASFFQSLLQEKVGFQLKKGKSGENALSFHLNETLSHLGKEGYRLRVLPEAIQIEASALAGLFYGIQTLRQLFPPEFEDGTLAWKSGWEVPAVTIEDKPQFPWRGLLLDCCRHFMSVDFVKRVIDLLAFYKLNRFHWHLTEDQGWRIEIKKYPKLTEIGAWRREPDGSVHGGFYTQEEIREVVVYAQERFVTVVPEIEMPGHSRAALAAYPELSCTGGPFEVPNQWSIYKDIYCAGNEETFRFLEDVLAEVLALFPSRYIHIGGDEAPKDRWKACPLCQKRIQTEGLKDEHELQSYFIKRMEKFLNAQGRQIIGWDEILEGGLAPGATVQSWRGEEGGVTAAKARHDVVMSPHQFVYFDHPVQFKSLKRVFDFRPVPAELSPEEGCHVLGSESCMWTEYVPQEKVDTMVFPRLLAFTEVVWAGDDRGDFSEFWQRTLVHYPRLEKLGVKRGPEAQPVAVQARFLPNEKRFEISLKATESGLEIFYTTDGSDTGKNTIRYEAPFFLEQTAVVKAQAFRDGSAYGAPTVQSVVLHKVLRKSVQVISPKKEVNCEGVSRLTDGLLGSLESNDGHWAPFQGEDFVGVLTFEEPTLVQKVRVRFLQNTSRRIFLPEKVTVFLREKGKDFVPVGEVGHSIPLLARGPLIQEFEISFAPKSASAIRLEAKVIGICPAKHPGEGEPAWLFADEIVVE